MSEVQQNNNKTNQLNFAPKIENSNIGELKVTTMSSVPPEKEEKKTVSVSVLKEQLMLAGIEFIKYIFMTHFWGSSFLATIAFFSYFAY